MSDYISKIFCNFFFFFLKKKEMYLSVERENECKREIKIDRQKFVNFSHVPGMFQKSWIERLTETRRAKKLVER